MSDLDLVPQDVRLAVADLETYAPEDVIQHVWSVARAPLLAEVERLKAERDEAHATLAELVCESCNATGFDIAMDGSTRGECIDCCGTGKETDRLRAEVERLKAEVAEVRNTVDVLAPVGRMYLDALDNDPENELLTLAGAYRVTEVREVVQRWEAAE